MLEKGTRKAEVVGPQENLAPIFAWVLANAMYAHLENGLNESAPSSPPANSDSASEPGSPLVPGSPADDASTNPDSSIVVLNKAVAPSESNVIENQIEVVKLKNVDVISSSSSSSSSNSARGSTVSDARVKADVSADTTGDLRKNLQLMAEQCQMLANQLKTVEPKQSTEHRTNSSPCAEETTIVSPCCAEIRRKFKAVTEENIRLRAVLKDVTGVNKRWQKYNKDRQQHIEKLLETIDELKAQVSSLEEAVQKANAEPKLANVISAKVQLNNAENVIAHRHSDSSLLDQSSSLRQSYENAVKENCTLQKVVEEQSQNINSLLQQIESIRSEKDERIQVLTVQLKSHKEDWEAEKREKEQAIERLAGVIEELSVLRNKCREQEQHNARRNGRILNGCGTEAYLQYTNGYCPQESPDPSAPELSVEIPSTYRTTTSFNIPARHIRVTERGLGGRRGRNGYYEFNAVMTDGASNEPGENRAVVNGKSTDELNELPASTAKDSNTVECPGCHVAFPSDRHVNFLDHFEACQARQAICSANT